MRVSGSPGAGARACAEAKNGSCPIERRCVSWPIRMLRRAARVQHVSAPCLGGVPRDMSRLLRCCNICAV